MDEKLFYKYFYRLENKKNVEIALDCFKMFLNFKCYDLNETVFKKFIKESCDKYQNVLYHNSDHALNTLNSGVFLLKNIGKIINKTTKIMFLLACYLHDIDHPGSKGFKNDSLELEEHHVEVIKIQMNKYRDLFFEGKLRIYDKIGILSDMIYSTNLICHDEILNEFINKYFINDNMTNKESINIRTNEGIDNIEINKDVNIMELKGIKSEVGPLELKMLIKIADISASYKPFETYRLNSFILNKEIKGESFSLNQIDNKMEVMFLKSTSLPLIEAFSRVFKGHNFMVDNCKSNIKEIEKLIEGPS